jgi:4-hydroxy-tetrahydrodipicolinate synthase
MGGTGSNSTQEAIRYTRDAEDAGVDAALVVAPYYNKPTQSGVFLHFREIANQTKLPIILYSIPGRCGIEISIETVLRLAQECPNILAIKEAGGSVDKVRNMRRALDAAGFKKFQILSGDDGLTLPFMSV